MQLIEWIYLGIFGVMLYSTVLWLIVYLDNREDVHKDPEPSYFPGVTFLVPAYNEEDYIAGTLESLLEQNYPSEKIEIIAINDGSEDNTLEEMKKYEDRIEIIDKENSGKSNSMNQALERVDTEVVACMDADSRPEKDFLKKMVGYLEEDGVKGVTPAMMIEDPETTAQRVVWFEYVYNLFLRKLFSIFDSQFVMPGPGSLYETKHLKEIGGWDEDTLTEDMEVVFRMMEAGAKIRNSTNAKVKTHSPPDFRGLLRQRSRWYRGNLNNAFRYRNVFLNPKFGNFGMVVIPFNLVWAALVMFIFGHFFYRLSTSLFDMAASIWQYGLQFSMPMISVQSLSLFHLFNVALAALGVFMLYMSISVSEIDLGERARKLDVVFFLIMYAFLYSVFWIKALADKFRGSKAW
ncbi:MAG: glycosyltransferase family 2 protein [Candidatus Nanohaloarchaea archaeon]